MKRTIPILLIVPVFLALFAFVKKKQNVEDLKIYGYSVSQIRTITEDPEHKYCLDSLWDRFEAGEKLPPKQMALLYYGHTTNIDYKPTLFYFMEVEIIEANTQFQHKKAIKLCDSLLGYHPVSMIAHEEAAYALGRTQDSLRSRFHQGLYEQIKKVVLGSGDGLTKETAFVVSTLKEIDFICDVKSMAVLKRKSIAKSGMHYEVCTGYHQGENKKFYFNTSLIKSLGNGNF